MLLAGAVLASVLPCGCRVVPVALGWGWELVIAPVLACVTAFLLRHESPFIQVPAVCVVVMVASFRLLLGMDLVGLMFAPVWGISCGLWLLVTLGWPRTLRAVTVFGWVQSVTCLGLLVVGFLAGPWGGDAFQRGLVAALVVYLGWRLVQLIGLL